MSMKFYVRGWSGRLIPRAELNADVICVNLVALALMIAHRLFESSFAERVSTWEKNTA